MLGFACKINKEHDLLDSSCSLKSTTITWLNSNPLKVNEKLESLLIHNMSALRSQLKFVGGRSPHIRMFRLSGDILPAYSHPNFMPFYRSKEISSYISSQLALAGDYARANNIRLSFHPGQFCVLASSNPVVVENSIVEIECHADIIRYMGYGNTFQDFKCNVHISGKNGPDGIRKVFNRLSLEARNTLTIENAEFSWGLSHSIELADICALVLDVHHDWIYSDRFISHSSIEITKIIDSWRGVKPVIHYSQSKVLEQSRAQGLTLASDTGFSKMALRAHSDYFVNHDLNLLIKEHYEWADIMCESKQKNLAVDQLSVDLELN